MYKSPIEIICTGIEQQFENNILKAIQHYEIQIDKDELIKALNYDRDQYIKGYNEAYNEAVANLQKKGVWIARPLPDDWVGTLYTCNNCGSVEDSPTTYCPRCGAKMKEDKTC